MIRYKKKKKLKLNDKLNISASVMASEAACIAATRYDNNNNNNNSSSQRDVETVPSLHVAFPH
jgi:hypothetical protein